MSHVKYIEIDHVLYFEKRMYEKKKKKRTSVIPASIYFCLKAYVVNFMHFIQTQMSIRFGNYRLYKAFSKVLCFCEDGMTTVTSQYGGVLIY